MPRVSQNNTQPFHLMKTILALLIASATWANAQTLDSAEYFLNSDPGPGNGTAFAITSGGSVSHVLDIPAAVIAALPEGTHFVYVRLRDSQGEWSVAEGLPFHKADLPPASGPQNITAAEYFIDADPGPGNGTAFTVPNSLNPTRVLDIPASVIAALSDGTHYVHVRLRDSGGDWSVAEGLPFHKADIPPSVDHLAARIDVQWFQNGSPVSPVYLLTPPGPGNPISFDQLIPLQGLQEGQSYDLVMTPWDDAGTMGVSESRTILIQTTDSNGDGIPDQWKTTYQFGIHDTIAGLDSDLDGLTNLEEFLAGTNPREKDTDSDGMNDKAEIDLVALGFDPVVADPTAVQALLNNANNAGLFSKSQLQALSVNSPLLERDASTGDFKLTIALTRSSDLARFDPFPFVLGDTSINPDGEIEFEFAPPVADVEFYRIESD